MAGRTGGAGAERGGWAGGVGRARPGRAGGGCEGCKANLLDHSLHFAFPFPRDSLISFA